ncbi:MAG: hypothetical protein KGI41_03850 [Patescibacteria group bacterium]|nr:hypothetical protein [Patescibacteria group bacterium]
MVYPDTFFDRVKYVGWRFYTPFHPFFRDIFVWLGIQYVLRKLRILRYRGRQDYLLGTLAPDESFREFIAFLLGEGYGNHFIAWKDDGQVASLRKTLDFRYQYHIRIFADGEVRGHYEYTPECRPWLHLKSVGQEPAHDVFEELLRGRVLPA